MSDTVLIASDNGFVTRRLGSTYSVVYADPEIDHNHNPFDLVLYGLSSVRNDCTRVITFEDCAGGGPTLPLSTQDSGSTWNVASIPTPPLYLTSNLFSVRDYAGLMDLVDYDGFSYIVAFSRIADGGDNHWHLLKSTDFPISAWSPIADLTTLGLGNLTVPISGHVVIAKNYFWWMPAVGLDVGFANLYRMTLDGSSLAVFPVDFATPGINLAFYNINPDRDGGNAFTIKANFDLDTMYAIVPAAPAKHSGSGALEAAPMLTINIADVNTPVMTWSGWSPVGADYYTQDVLPLNDTDAVAVSWHNATPTLTGAYDLGKISRTTNKGVSWTDVVAPTSHLSSPYGTSVIGNSGVSRVQSLAAGQYVWAASAAPYVYQSANGGLTWTEETVDISIYTPFFGEPGDEAPTQWSGIAVVCVAEFPGLSSYQNSDAIQTYFVRT